MKNDSKDATKNKAQLATQGEQLAKALDWILEGESFANVQLHGNVNWIVSHLVRVAMILWVWSSKRQLVESANDAIEKTVEICKSTGIDSYQVLTKALIRYGVPILDCLQRRMHQLMERTDSLVSVRFRRSRYAAKCCCKTFA